MTEQQGDVSQGPPEQDGSAQESPAQGEILADLLVEEVSIDGMCGVY